MSIDSFKSFFDNCVGNWLSERTYHYLTHEDIERSKTEFEILPLTSEQKTQVLKDNEYTDTVDLDNIPGFNLSFYTISDKGEEVRQTLNLLFVVKQQQDIYLEGDYLRDKAYEESRPIISHFRFNTESRELLMTTNYTRVVSVDSITLVNPTLRIRKILNYQRPEEGKPLDQVVLVGFGVEQKVSSKA